MYRVLLVDDEPIAIEALKNLVAWGDLGFQLPLSAENASQAKIAFRENIIDVLICDIEMPNENGIELLKWVRQNHLECIPVFLTCHDDFIYAQEGIRYQLFDYLLKPVSQEKLEDVLRRAASQLGTLEAQHRASSYFKDFIRETSSSDVNSSHADAIVEEIKQYINIRISSEISREQIAKHVFLSPDYISKIFRRYTDKSISEYITEQRMTIAGELLVETILSISKIAISVGFTHMGHFSNTFKKKYNLSPMEYRRKYKQV